jgi:hypothetical protein
MLAADSPEARNSLDSLVEPVEVAELPVRRDRAGDLVPARKPTVPVDRGVDAFGVPTG